MKIVPYFGWIDRSMFLVVSKIKIDEPFKPSRLIDFSLNLTSSILT